MMDASRPFGLVLKYRPPAQSGLIYGEAYRFHRKYLPLMESNAADHCLIYVPRAAAPEISRNGSEYCAVTCISFLSKDDQNPDFYIAQLYRTADFLYPVPFRYAGFQFDSGSIGLRDRHVEQSSIQAISEENYLRIQNFGFAGSPPETSATDAQETGTYTGFAEADAASSIPRQREIMTRHKRSGSLRRLIMEVDQGQCVLSGFHYKVDQSEPLLEVAHVKPVSAGGQDTARNCFLCHATYHALFDALVWSFSDCLKIIWTKHYSRVPISPPLDDQFRARFIRPRHQHLDLDQIRWHRTLFEEREKMRHAKSGWV